MVLVDPEIPQNTGNIGRLCAATGSVLHLVGTLGFDISQKAVRRAGMDYWQKVDVRRHETLEEFLEAEDPPAVFFMSSRGTRPYFQMDFLPGAALVFGSESKGLPRAVLDTHPERVFAIPTVPGIRSHNLANAVSIVLYEALRRTGAMDGLSDPRDPSPGSAPRS